MADDSDTVPVTGRDLETTDCETTSNSEAFKPDGAWLDAFQKQLTPKLNRELLRYARERALYVATSGYKVDAYFARELAQDVVVDTWTGVLRWDPERCTLKTHLAKAIRTRSHKLRERYRKSPHIYIDDRDDDDGISAAEEAASVVVGHTNVPIQHIYAREVVDMVRKEAADDKDVLRIVDALEAGAETREDVLAFARMRERTYHNAHTRLMRIVRKLNRCKLAPKA